MKLAHGCRWALSRVIRPRRRIGMYTEKVGGQTYVRGSFAIPEDRVEYPYQQAR